MRTTSPLKTQQMQQNIHQTKSSALRLPSFQANSQNRLSNKLKIGLSEDKINNYSRFIPKNFSKDKQELYGQNIKLRQKIKQLTDHNIRLKTQLSKSEKQKNQLIQQAQKFVQQSQKIAVSKSLHQPKPPNNNSTNLNNNTLVRKILKDANQQISKLKTQNAKIKKNIKYTQINEIKIENKTLLQQLIRLQNYIQEIKQQSSNYLQNQQHNQELRKKIVKLNDKLKQYQIQIIRKQQEIDELKEKLQKAKKIKNQNILNRQVNQLKKRLNEARKSTFSKRNQQEKNDSFSKFKINQQVGGSLKKLQNITVNNLKGNSKKSEKLQEKKSTQFNSNKHDINSQKAQANKNKIISQIQIKRTSLNNKKKQLQEDMPQQYYEEQFEQMPIKQEFKNHTNQSTSKKQSIPKQIQEKQSEDFHIDEEINNAHHQGIGKASSQITKNSQIDKILQQTIKYKFLAQQYTYEDFSKDMKNTNVKQFSYEQVSKLLSSEPFYLLDHQKNKVLSHCFGKENQISTATLLRKIKPYIGDAQIFSQTQEKKVEQKLTKYFRSNHTKIKKQLKKIQAQDELVSKQNFIKVLRDNGVEPRQIEYCLGEICVLSVDIENLNYKDFLQRFLKQD